MSWIVRVALTRPYTFVVMAVLIAIFGVFAAVRMPVDIFPQIRIPIVGVIFQYPGMPADEMAGRIVENYERVILGANDLEHIESQSIAGTSVVKVFFQPGVDLALAQTQVAAFNQLALRRMPAGTQPPILVSYNVATVPIVQIATSSPTLSGPQLNDVSQTVVRTGLLGIRGLSMPLPYGGALRQVQVDLDPAALTARQMSGLDVQNAMAAQMQILPSGGVKIGPLSYVVKLNSASEGAQHLNDMPIRTVDGSTIYIRDVGQARDGAPAQVNSVHVDGKSAVLFQALRNGSSTLAIIDEIKGRLPRIREQLPDDFGVTLLSDQSVFVQGAINSVVREGLLAAALTSLLIYLFLGSWRSTVIIATSIPLAVLASVAGLGAMGQTLNIMTLGGLALAVGILVDDATVTMENINWHLEQGKDVRTAILDGANQIVAPAFVSLLCICIVFVPMFTLQGLAGFLFVPLAWAVVLAMIASFVLSRTLVPTMAMYLLRPHDPAAPQAAPARNPVSRVQRAFAARFEGLRAGYRETLLAVMGARRGFAIGFVAAVGLSLLLTPLLGRNFFPAVDSGQISMQVRGPSGLRLEETSLLFKRVEEAVRQAAPGEVASIVDNIGIPSGGATQVYRSWGITGAHDGEVFITLKPGHQPSEKLIKRLRETLPAQFPGVSFAFVPADIVAQILNVGAPAPLDVQVGGRRAAENRVYATELLRRIRQVPGLADVRLHQPAGAPELRIDVDRARILQLGLSERDVASSVLTYLAGNGNVAPNFWMDPKTQVSYSIAAQTPEYRLTSLSDLETLPITGAGARGVHLLGGLGTIRRDHTPVVVNRYDVSPVLNIFATPQGRDLGGAADVILKILKETAKDLPKGSTVTLRGQSVTMNRAFGELFFGLLAAIVLVYLMIVVNFQSWTDPLVIITALPAALAGIVWMLFVTGTSLSVPALTGAIMCMGVATANSILVISFARERLAATGDALAAAIDAGVTRFRPVVMTALAMIIGMTPMALGLGEGGEQNAPLGKAVIGGLIFATIATLLFVPVMFSLVHERRGRRAAVGGAAAHA